LEIIFFYSVIISLIAGNFSAFIAKEKNRNHLGWFFLGFFFSIIALIALIAVPKLSNKEIKEADGKNLKPIVIYLILNGGIVILLIIFSLTGVLNSTSIDNRTETLSNPSSSVDLNNMNAINDLEEKVKQNPQDYVSLLELAHLKNDSGLLEAAISDYKKYLIKFPENADARVDMGVCYFNLKDYTNAIKEMESAVKTVPDHQIAHLNLGVVNLSAGNIEKSKEWLKKAYDLNPTNEVGLKAEQLLKNH